MKRNQAGSASAPAKKSLKELFEERDRSRPGSTDEEETTKKILETVFPDTNGR